MSSFGITHLSYVGPAVDAASVTFGEALNVVHGPTDTGKSFIRDSFDYLLGGRPPEVIPEEVGYTTILLGLRWADGSSMTLARPRNGGRISVYDQEVYGYPSESEASRVLAGKHDRRSEANISRFLLQRLDLDMKFVRKNARNVTNMLSFRNLVDVCMVDETSMIDKRPPFFTGQKVNETAEKSTLKLLLQGEDDSGLTLISDVSEERILSRGKSQMLDDALKELTRAIEGAPEAPQLLDQLRHLERTLADTVRAIAEISTERDQAIERRSRSSRDVYNLSLREAEVAELSARFELLKAQYESDLARLEMIREAGTYLGYFTPGTCAFCGAGIEHQADNIHLLEETTSLAHSVTTEKEKTEALLADLALTLMDLSEQVTVLRGERRDLEGRLADADRRVAELERMLAPSRESLDALIVTKSTIERQLAVYEQVQNLNALRGSIPVATQEKLLSPRVLDRDVVGEFAGEVRDMLDKWRLPQAAQVSFSDEEFDLVIEGQLRSSRGKGMRSILRAAAILSLAQYCLRRNLPHPGVVVLDSPLVTYRQPDITDADEAVDETVAAAFFKYLDEEFLGQAIILENVDPPTLTNRSRDIAFTGTRGDGRYGFFSPRQR